MVDGHEVDRARRMSWRAGSARPPVWSAQSECQLLELIGEFDAVNAIRWWVDVKSLAHWLSWCCSMSPGTAREHVRVARALRRTPTITAAFRAGRLSYSKVREATRVVGVIDEEKLCQLALTATAAQLARTVSGYRAVAGSRIEQERKRSLTWTERDHEVVDFRVRLPKEEAALVIAALTAAKDQFGTPPPTPTPHPKTAPERTASLSSCMSPRVSSSGHEPPGPTMYTFPREHQTLGSPPTPPTHRRRAPNPCWDSCRTPARPSMQTRATRPT